MLYHPSLEVDNTYSPGLDLQTTTCVIQWYQDSFTHQRKWRLVPDDEHVKAFAFCEYDASKKRVRSINGCMQPYMYLNNVY